MEDIQYSLDEICLIPNVLTIIKHRKDVNCFYDNKLPIFIAPMTCLIDSKNIDTIRHSKFIPIYPIWNKETVENRKKANAYGWIAVTLSEFEDYYLRNKPAGIKDKVLIDTANGHMFDIYDLSKRAKEIYGDNITIMVGNIANPETYITCADKGVDYVRIGIGGGSGCTTAVQTGMHTSIPWMLKEINKLKNFTSNKHTKVVADGGINTIGKVVKALALGADYVMIGKLFGHCEECAHKDRNFPVSTNLYYGQASVEGQLDRFGEVRNTPEGIARELTVQYTIEQLEQLITGSLRSSMSYANAQNLKEFIGKVRYGIQSNQEFKLYDK